jgi:DNA-binding NtrC family response regulator
MSSCAILCVDDDAIILLALKQELRIAFGNRFIYETALDANRALAAFEHLHVKGIRIIVVISDWLMPAMKGDEFLKIVQERYPDTKALMITGQASEEMIAELIEQGVVVKVLKKPWKSKELIDCINACCEDVFP